MRIAVSILALVTALCTAAPASAVDDTERLAVYKEFRTAFDAKQFAAALPIAEKLVALTEQQYNADNAALINPLSNLGTVYFRMNNYAAAETQYQRAVRLVEARGGGADRQLILPLQGLGETWFAARQFPEAAVALKRAVDISRNLDGLFNAEQLPILNTLIDSYVASGRNTDAEKEHQYAFRVASTNFGERDLRLLGPIDRYARWFEYVGRYVSARALHGRGLQLAEQLAGIASAQTVTPLRGIARSYMAEYLYGGEKEEEAPQENPGFPSAAAFSGTVTGLNPDGEKALRLAIAALTKSPAVDKQLRGDTLIDLGDWYLVGGSQSKARDTYRLAWDDLTAVKNTQRLAAPRQLAYRAPLGSVARSKPSKPDEWEEKAVDVSFLVAPDGAVKDVKLVSGDIPEAMVKSLTLALRKALYAPRIVAGQAEATADVRFVEHMLVRKPAPPAAPENSTSMPKKKA